MITFIDLCAGNWWRQNRLRTSWFYLHWIFWHKQVSKRTYDLMHNIENELFWNNIKKINATNVPKYDVLIADFPCRTFSVIGRKEGFDDSRGQIIFTLSEILKFSQPKAFISKKRKRFSYLNKGRTLKIILNELSNAGYQVFHKVLTTFDYGVPQNRKRIYFVGIRNDIDSSSFSFPVNHSFGGKNWGLFHWQRTYKWNQFRLF